LPPFHVLKPKDWFPGPSLIYKCGLHPAQYVAVKAAYKLH
jgi:hypothetical protein